MAHILFTTMPIPGHVRPGLPIARELTRRGHRVSWTTGRSFEAPVARVGGDFLPIPQALEPAADRPGKRVPSGLRQLRRDVRDGFLGVVPAYVRHLDGVFEREQPDVVVADQGFVAGPLLAEQQAIPNVIYTVTPLMLSSSETAPFGTGLAPSATALGRLRNRALNLLVRHAVFGDSHRAAQALRRDLGLPPLAGSFLDWGAVVADRYLHTTIPEFEYPRGDLPGTLEFVGTPPLGGVDDWSRPAWWGDLAAARDRGRPVVVLTQGTVATEPSNLLLPAIEALGRSDVLVVATTGGPDPESVLPERRRPANLRLETFVPFAQLLPLVDLVVTNGGYGGVQSALAHGVPLVTAGRSEDKMEVNARVAWSGAGISLKTDRPTPRQIADAVSAVLGTSAYRDRAQALRDAYSRYDAPRRAADLILVAAAKRGLQQAKPTGRTGRGSGLHFTPARRHAICR